ncbi:MAG: DUF2892 domain-containing protein [Rhodospirillales bacterium]|nr:DUF2892 domain-containing protein [Rhodospirillales bacterium]
MCAANIDRIVMRFAGAVVLFGLFLGYFVHGGWFFLSAFVGVNLIQASFTGFCPLAKGLKMFGIKPGAAFE